MPANPNDDPLIQAAMDGDFDWLARALSEGANAKSQESLALARAARHGHAACVKLLIPVSDPKAHCC